jgi:hypothetical protein
MSTKVKIGDKFKLKTETRFGKEIVTIVEVVAINDTSVFFDNGDTFHLINFK